MFRRTHPILRRMESYNVGVVNSVHRRMDNYDGQVINAAGTMTVNGTIAKALLLILIAAIAGGAVFYEAAMGYTDKVLTIMQVAVFGGIVTGFATSFVPKLAKFLSPIYAFCEGAFLTAFSLVLETQFPGIAVQAISGTMICFFVMLFLYRIGAVRATEKFRATLMSAMITILVLYLVAIACVLLNFYIPFISSFSPMAIVFSTLVVLIAALNFILDFDFIEKGQANYLPKDMEWYGAFGMLVTLVWLYVEILKLIRLFRSK